MKVNISSSLSWCLCSSLTLVLFCLTILSFQILSTSTSVLADSVTVTTINITESCTLTSTTNTAHTATLLNGTYSGTNYATGIGQTTLKTFCNDNGGFAIYAIGYTSEEYGNNTLHWNKAANASDDTNAINTGIYTADTTVNSTWSMKLASVAGTYAPIISDGTNNTENFTNWHVIPGGYTKVAYRNSGTDIELNGSGTGSSITVTYDAYISAGQPAGSYNGKVKYTLVHPVSHVAPVFPLNVNSLAITNAVVYAPNDNDVEGDMSSLGTTTALANASSRAGMASASVNSTVELIAPNYKRAGYGFAGWSTSFDATTDEDPIIYGPNETVSTNPNDERSLDVSNGVALYPVWIESAGDLQNWHGCTYLEPASYNTQTGALTATLDSITALTDTRDNNVYAVARLADGECWMVENLRLNNEDTTSAEDIAKAQLYGNATTSINASGNNLGRFIGLPASEDANFADNTTANSLYSIDGSNGTININSNSSYYPDYRLPRYNNNNTNMATSATNSDGTTLEDKYNTYDNANDNHLRWYGYGNYYNWPAAIANTEYFTTYSGNNGSDAAGTSICPTGWHLPLGYTSTGALDDNEQSSTWRVGGFSYLDRKMGGTGQSQSSTAGTTQSALWRKFPNNFVYSGNWYGTQAYNRSTYGNYWSSSASNGSSAYYLYFNSSYVGPGLQNHRKYYGTSVRCVCELKHELE